LPLWHDREVITITKPSDYFDVSHLSIFY
jgi:hypothetical protein